MGVADFFACCCGSSSRSSRDGTTHASHSPTTEGVTTTPVESAETVLVHLMRDDRHKSSSNAIVTAKYSIVTFLPLNLLEQFRRVSNIYFLLVMICTLIPGATSVNPYSAVVPFVFVLGVAAVKDGFEDWKRHRADAKANAMPARVLRPKEGTSDADEDPLHHNAEAPPSQPLQQRNDPPNNMNFDTTADDTNQRRLQQQQTQLSASAASRNKKFHQDYRHERYVFTEVPAQDIRVGQIVKYYHGDEIRADSVILHTSLPDGLAYIETANLDGETNAKVRKAKPVTSELFTTEERIVSLCAAPRLETQNAVRSASTSHVDRKSPYPSSPARPMQCPFQHQQAPIARRLHQRTDSAHTDPHTWSAVGSENEQEPPAQLPNRGMGSKSRATRMTPTESDVAAQQGDNSPRLHPNHISNRNDDVRGPQDRNQRLVVPDGSPDRQFSEARGSSVAEEGPPPAQHVDTNNASIANDDAHYQQLLRDMSTFHSTGIAIETGVPNPNLALWHGKMHLPDGTSHPLGIDQFIPRGCVLRNTEWIICATVFTGSETKMMLNLRQRPMKQSVMDQKLNKINMFLFIANQSVIFLFCGLGVQFIQDSLIRHDPDLIADGHRGTWYMQYRLEEYGLLAMFFWRYLSVFAIISYLIPLSLYVSLEFVKATQIAYIAKDDHMAIRMPNGELRYPRPKTSNLNVQLAHVKYIFTDKTGTLTENMMRFVGGFTGEAVFDANAVPGGLGLQLVETLYPSALVNIPATLTAAMAPSSDPMETPTDRAAAPTNRFLDEETAPFTQTTTFPTPREHKTAPPITAAPINGQPSLLHRSLSLMVDDVSGLALQPHQLCMQFSEASVVANATYRYLLALSLCHTVVCFDPEMRTSHAAAKGHSRTASRASSLGGMRRRSSLNRSKVMTRGGSVASFNGGPANLNSTRSPALSRVASTVNPTLTVTDKGRIHDSMATLELEESHTRHNRVGSVLNTSAAIHSRFPSLILDAGHRRTISSHQGVHGVWRSPIADRSEGQLKTYEGQSLDEVALVKAARENGFELVHRSVRQIVVDIFGTPVVYDIIAELEFTPQRKMMSIILKRNRSADKNFAALCRSNDHRLASFHHHHSSSHHRRTTSAKTTLSPKHASNLPFASDASARKSRQPSHQQSIEGQSTPPDPPNTNPNYIMTSPMSAAPNQGITSSINVSLPPAITTGDHGSGGFAEFPKMRVSETHGTANASASPTKGSRSGRGVAFSQQGHQPRELAPRAESPTTHSLAASSGPPPPPALDPISLALSGMSSATAHSEYIMLTKGADSSVLAQLDPKVPANLSLRANFEAALEDMASTGLRTLVLACRTMEQGELDSWLPKYQAALVAADRDDALHVAYAEVEHSLTLVGTTAVEDRLQDGVPETLEFLLAAEIVVWMLTGDKRETAVTIAATSGLVDPTKDDVQHINVSQMSMDSNEAIEAATVEVLRQLDGVKQHLEAEKSSKQGQTNGPASDGNSRIVMVIDGLSLQCVLRDPARASVFFEVGAACRSAVCCRMTPLQKAEIVRMFQENTQGVALAIGDGANDVSMIQESRIGIGIMGLEGAQAELASDFAIPKFRHLKRLLVVHGRNALYRESQCILFSIYKNIVMTSLLMWYCEENGFTGLAMVDTWELAMFNVFFVSLPPLLMGIVDVDIEDELAETHPQLYPPLAKEDMYMNPRALLTWLVDGLVHGFAVYFLTMEIIRPEGLHPYYSEPLEHSGFFMYAIIVYLTNFIAIGTLRVVNVFTIGGMLLSLATVISLTLAHSDLPNLGGLTEMVGVTFDTYGSHMFWVYFVFFNVGVLALWNVARSFLLRSIWPENNTIIARVAADRAWRFAKLRWSRRRRQNESLETNHPNHDLPNSNELASDAQQYPA